MTLRERYRTEELATLIAIVESEKYSKETITVVVEEMEYRKPDEEEVKKIASDLMRKKAKSLWDGFSGFKEPITPPTSKFLKEEEVLIILRAEYELWSAKREDMSIDVWTLAMGG
jgi:hypothetical protein